MRGRPRLPVELQRRFWRLVRVGVGVADAALAVGVSSPTGLRWFRQAGGVIPSLVEPTGLRLSFAEREEIACLRAAGRGVRQIARHLGRDPATISRELRRLPAGGTRP